LIIQSVLLEFPKRAANISVRDFISTYGKKGLLYLTYITDLTASITWST